MFSFQMRKQDTINETLDVTASYFFLRQRSMWCGSKASYRISIENSLRR